MRRRSLLHLVFGAAGLVLVATLAAAPSRGRPILLQESALAGFQYHAGERCSLIPDPSPGGFSL